MNIKRRFNELKSVLGLSLSLAKANFKVRNEGSVKTDVGNNLFNRIEFKLSIREKFI